MGEFAASDFESMDYHTANSADSRAPIIDLTRLARQSLGDEQLEVELLDLFEHQAGRILAQLTRPGQDRKTLSDLAHKLKGSAMAIGAGRVAEKAARLEEACEGAALAPNTAAVLAELTSAVEEARGAILKLIA